MLSYWEQKEFICYDYCVLGAGITGLSTACELAEREPTAKILVLERGLLPSGASTKNAGFACIGSLSEKLHDLELMGQQAFLQLIENRWQGLGLLRARLADHNTDYQNHGGYELVLTKQNASFINRLDEMNRLLEPIIGSHTFSVRNELINAFGFNKEHV